MDTKENAIIVVCCWHLDTHILNLSQPYIVQHTFRYARKKREGGRSIPILLEKDKYRNGVLVVIIVIPISVNIGVLST